MTTTGITRAWRRMGRREGAKGTIMSKKGGTVKWCVSVNMHTL